MAFYDEMAVMALEMITEFGQPVTISKTEPGEYDPETGGEAPGVPVEQTAQGILLDFTGIEFQNNSLIRQGDKKLKIAAQGLAWVSGPAGQGGRPRPHLVNRPAAERGQPGWHTDSL